MAENAEIYSELEQVHDTLNHVRLDVDNKADKVVLSKAMELIDSVMWKYEEDVEWLMVSKI